mgnify:CR=1 FL=1
MADASDMLEQIMEVWESPGFATRRGRMEDDYSLYRLNSYKVPDGYQSYTSNAPKIFADKIVSFLSESNRIVRVAQGMSEEMRERESAKEKWLIGCLNLADERLRKQGHPSVKEQLSFYTVIRGWYCGRAVLNKYPNGTTYVDITPYDPLRFVYESDEDGMIWGAYLTRRSRRSIKALYKLDIPPETPHEDENRGVDVWDYYDRESNAVIVDDGAGKFAKKPEPHNVVTEDGMACVPLFYGSVGAAPMVQTINSSDDTQKDAGESVFSSNRELYDEYNFAMSAMKTLVRRAVKHPYKILSPDGTVTLDSDPWKDGSEIPLPAGTDIQLLDEVKMPIASDAFVGLLSSEIQRGSLSNVTYGELPFAISGYAARILQAGNEHQILPRVDSLNKAYVQIGEMLVGQYLTGGFEDMEVRGRHNDLRVYFNEEVSPDMIRDIGPLDVTHTPNLPEDDPQRVTMAQMMREGPQPLAPDEWIWENVLNIQDVDQFRRRIEAQQGRVLDPKAAMTSIIEALIATGDKDKALIYVDMLRKLLKQEQQQETVQDAQYSQLMAQTLGAQMPGQPPGQPPPPQNGAVPPAQGGASALNLPGEAISSAAMGFPPQPPGPEVVAGAQQPRNRGI